MIRALVRHWARFVSAPAGRATTRTSPGDKGQRFASAGRGLARGPCYHPFLKQRTPGLVQRAEENAHRP
jgi:hypothetical protein